VTALPWQECYAGLRSGFDTDARDRADVEAQSGRGAAAYGEPTEHAVARLLRWLAPGPEDVFVDLGSGTGRLCMQVAEQTNAGTVLGIELSTQRDATARTAASRWLAGRPDTRPDRVQFVRGDLRACDLSAVTLVWAGATCFPPAVLRHVACALTTLPRLRCAVLTCALPEPWHRQLHQIGHLNLETTWAHRVRCHVYAGKGWRRNSGAVSSSDAS